MYSKTTQKTLQKYRPIFTSYTVTERSPYALAVRQGGRVDEDAPVNITDKSKERMYGCTSGLFVHQLPVCRWCEKPGMRCYLYHSYYYYYSCYHSSCCYCSWYYFLCWSYLRIYLVLSFTSTNNMWYYCVIHTRVIITLSSVSRVITRCVC